LKKIIIFALSLSCLELNAMMRTSTQVSTFDIHDFDQRSILTSFNLTSDSYDDIIDEYKLWNDIPDFWITPYFNIKTLKISTRKTSYNNKHLQFLPELFPYITELNIQSTQIENETILYILSKFKNNIETLNLDGCNLGHYCDMIAHFNKLKKLYLSGNNLSSLHFLTKNITHLDVSSNPLQKQEILNIYKQSPHLQELTISKNILVPHEIKFLWLSLQELSYLKIGDVIQRKNRILQHSA
jgi:hypothetical protein